MKKCSICNQTYTDESLNFCLSDGGTLMKISDDAPPTVFLNKPRTTNQTNWPNNDPFGAPNFGGQVSPWQDQSAAPNPSYMASNPYQTPNQTLSTVSLVLGIAGILLFCCYGGIPFGIGAMITGYLGFSSANKDPMRYGGKGLAIAGMIMGAVSFFGVIVMLLFALLANI